MGGGIQNEHSLIGLDYFLNKLKLLPWKLGKQCLKIVLLSVLKESMLMLIYFYIANEFLIAYSFSTLPEENIFFHEIYSLS